MTINLHGTDEGDGGLGPSDPPGLSEELECKICYCGYTLGARRPKVLDCCHRLCTKCLAKILDLGECPPNAVVCPFCRYVTALQAEALSSLPDDCNLVAALAFLSRNRRNLQEATSPELLLSPSRLGSLMGGSTLAVSPSSSTSSSSSSSASSSYTTYSSIRSSPNFVVITIMEPPPPQARISQELRGLRPASLDSVASGAHRWTLWNCATLLLHTSARALVWVLGLLYFSSLPMGVYLLIMQRTTLGVLLVSLVPASLAVVMAYGVCQCICHELRACMAQ